MPTLRIAHTGILHRNPTPHVHSIHAYFPSVAAHPSGHLLATITLGEAFEAPNLHTHLCRSTDGGHTWQHQGRISPTTPDRLTSDSARLTALPNGDLILFMIRHDRTAHPHEGLTNPHTLGFVPTELLLLRSHDLGHTWTEPTPLTPPLVGPAFELCCPITPLADGHWILPTSTWPNWQGHCPNGIKMIALISGDHGATWPTHWDVMTAPKNDTFFWESKIIELPDTRLLATAWAYNHADSHDLPNHYTLSTDHGATWTAPRPTDLLGQTLTPHALPDGRILSVYRRMDEPGLWAALSHLQGDTWVTDSHTPLWGAHTPGLTATTDNMAHNFNVLRFGAPCITPLPDGTLFVAFWCYEDCVSNIRWLKLAIG